MQKQKLYLFENTMTFTQQANDIIQKKNSLLCVGLDSVIEKMPKSIQNSDDPLFNFNKEIIDATAEFASAFKVNLAFYEAHGLAGWRALQKTFEYLPDDVVKIADAKRGDIGNTAKMYADAVFEELKADAVTVNPYMGFDAAEPFLRDETKGVFFLCLTSNSGSQDFQHFTNGQEKLYEKIAATVKSWNTKGNCGLVVGATHPEELSGIRAIAGDMPFLIPGIGAQGGDLEASVKHGASRAAAFFNSSRGIIYTSNGNNFAQAAAHAAKQTMQQLNNAR
jgi:orotidine-5'-phosphate decarboxylase